MAHKYVTIPSDLPYSHHQILCPMTEESYLILISTLQLWKRVLVETQPEVIPASLAEQAEATNGTD